MYNTNLPKLNFLIALIVTIPLQVRFLPTITNSFPDSQNFITHIHVSTLTILQYGITIVQLNLLLMYAIVCIQDLYIICHECFKFCSMEIMPMTTRDHAVIAVYLQCEIISCNISQNN